MLKIAICDDSKVDGTIIREFVSEYLRQRELAAEVRLFEHPDTLLSECETFRPHICILDIIMPMVTGIEAAKEMRWNQMETQIIFTTSDPAFALESFEVNPINYLLKPVVKSKLFESLDLSIRHLELDDEKSVSVKVRGGYVTIQNSDILYLDYCNHVVTYHLKNNETVSTTTLRIGFVEYLRQNFRPEELIQCHESLAVNRMYIEMISRESILLRNKESIPVSKSRYKSVLELYFQEGN